MMEEGKKAWDLVFWNTMGGGVGGEFVLFPAAAFIGKFSTNPVRRSLMLLEKQFWPASAFACLVERIILQVESLPGLHALLFFALYCRL
jgi:hypothetical protein